MKKSHENTPSDLDTVPRARTVEGMENTDISRDERITIPGIRAAFEKAKRVCRAQLLEKLSSSELSTSCLKVRRATNTDKEAVDR